MEPNNTTYPHIYEGPYYDPILDETIYDPTYWRNEVAYYIERTNKLTPDKPCIIIKIPFDQLLIANNTDEVLVADFALREWVKHIDFLNSQIYNRSRTDKENGAYYCFRPTNAILKRNASYVEIISSITYLCLMITIQFPFKKRDKAMRMLCKMLPVEVDGFINNFNREKLSEDIKLYNKQEKIRTWLKSSEYCVFIANGSLLPRCNGTEDPLKNSLPFKSPTEDEIEILGIKGMGVRKGVTVITGGGYSGKSTLLDAISAGIYNHISGDGREFVITDDTAMEISAEDGRVVRNINISTFIKWVPGGETEHFSTEHASGSTSQAANIMEAINFGCKTLLIDEDTSATNFMIRDNKMKMLIKHEPITPFTDRVNQLYHEIGVSTILVIGGSGEYLSVADNIIMMIDFIPENVTKEAKKLCEKAEIIEPALPSQWYFKRNIENQNFTSYPEGNGTEKLLISDLGFVFLGDERIDIRALYNISSAAQLSAIVFLIRQIEISNQDNIINIDEKIDDALKLMNTNGVDSVFSTFFPNCERWLELPRKNEIYAVINRMRKLNFINEGVINQIE
jgi:predicted ABC-class ATPase